MNGSGYILGAPPGNVKDAIDTILMSWKQVDDERINWSLEKAELEGKVKSLQESVEMHEKVQKNLAQRIKMLEHALNRKSIGIPSSDGGLGKENGLGAKASRKVRWKTLPTYLPKGRLTPERIRAIVEDLMASKGSSSKKAKIEEPTFEEPAPPVANDNNVLQEQDVKDEEPVKIPAPSPVKEEKLQKSVPQKIDCGPITGEYKKLQEVEVKRSELGKWSPIAQMRSHLDGVRCISFHPTSALLFSGSEDGTSKLWSLEKMIKKKKASKKLEPTYTFRGHLGMVTSTAASGDRLASGGVDGKVLLLGYPDDGKDQYTTYGTCCPFTLNTFRHKEAVWSLAISKKYLYSACSDGNVRAWEANFEEQKEAKIEYSSLVDGKNLIPTSVVLKPTEDHLVVSYTTGDVAVFDIETGKEIAMIKAKVASHTMDLTVHPFLNLAVTANLDGSYHILDLSQGTCVDVKQNAHRDAVTSIAIDNNGVAMATASHDQSIRIWDIRNNAITVDMDPNQHRKKYDEAIHCIAYHPKIPVLASGGADSVVKVFIG
ncbi:hypothetical protein AAMO2058_000947100 [Amorphochlora amoebiformis]|uniref:Striatin N-terminal domain-containing protein n=1 Tax=Amorphochlora amoebiformis TaxID=1561963 RepID=A0A7S0H1N3_9EUKA|mmetsp:Transcript_2837/g.4298  ORF Transcript_2837/g.4298 Transcript_2837/m.4298 type:complete len:543 (+) Transcript_2837:49-1677(+)